jgi:hypothetical protein
MLVPFAMRRQIALDIGFDRDLAVGGAGDPQIGDPGMPQAVERLVGVFDADNIAQPVARQVLISPRSRWAT